MFKISGAAMRRALAATRVSNPAQATRIIQDALRGRAGVEKDAGAELEIYLPESIGNDGTNLARRSYALPKPRKGLAETIRSLTSNKSSLLRPKPVEPHIEEGAVFLRRNQQTRAGNRDYRLYVPHAAPPRGLIVMLHGCKQTAEDFAVGTNMNAVAQKEGLLVAYPMQNRMANQSGCWNWFQPKDQAREGGEPEIIAALTRTVMKEYGFDKDNVFVAGLSAGGAMAAVMGATYPDLFDSIGVHSGLAYKSASDVNSAFAAMRGAGTAQPAQHTQRNPPRQIVFHGSSDHTVAPVNAKQMSEMVRSQHGQGDTLHRRFSAGGRSVDQTLILGLDGAVRTEEWMIEGSGHSWSGGNPQGSYTEPNGPDASLEMVRFFLRKPANTPL